MSLRLITISSLLLLAITSILLTGFHCKGAKNVGCVAASDEEVHPKSVYAVPASAAAREKTSSSRKMVIDTTTIRNKKTGKSYRRVTLSRNKNVNVVAFTADYHQPRHHPPKNN